MISPENIYASDIYRLNKLSQLHVTTINVKRSHGLEQQQRGVYGKVWREKREGWNDVITL